jgi:hypothetical protein
MSKTRAIGLTLCRIVPIILLAGCISGWKMTKLERRRVDFARRLPAIQKEITADTMPEDLRAAFSACRSATNAQAKRVSTLSALGLLGGGVRDTYGAMQFDMISRDFKVSEATLESMLGKPVQVIRGTLKDYHILVFDGGGTGGIYSPATTVWVEIYKGYVMSVGVSGTIP